MSERKIVTTYLLLDYYPLRSIAERGGCFQRRLFVRQHHNFQTIKCRMMKLGG